MITPGSAGARAASGGWLRTLERLAGCPRSVQRQKFTFVLVAFAPIMLLFLAIRVIPILWVLGLSVTNYSLRRPTFHFVGLENFSRMLTDPQFTIALKNTLEFVLISVPATVILGLLLAVLMNQRIRYEGALQTLYFLPFILPTVPASIIWKWIYAPGDFGLANNLLHRIGLPSVPWMTNASIALLAVIAMYVWKHLGYYVIIFLVGLKSIPTELREASAVDGASPSQTVRHIELPLLRPILLFGTVYATIAAMAVFTIVYVMAEGSDISAGSQISVLATRIYQEAFTYMNMGYASAISFVLFVVALVAVLIQFYWLGRE